MCSMKMREAYSGRKEESSRDNVVPYAMTVAGRIDPVFLALDDR